MSRFSKISKPIFVGICGPSTSGKSSLADFLNKKIDAQVINLDNFFKKKAKRRGDKDKNIEKPKNLMIGKLIKSLKDLKKGKKVLVPSKRFTEKFDKSISPKGIIIVEGFLLFYSKKISDFFDLKIFLDLPMGEVVKRRVEFSGEEEREYCNKFVIPVHKKYRKKMLLISDYVLDGKKPKAQVKKEALEIINSFVKNFVSNE